jgi:hypothetical protein
MADVTRREVIGTLAATAGVGALLAATAAQAKDVEPYHHDDKGSDLHVEWGLVHKPKGGEYRVKFRKAFAGPPAVVLTPWWDNQGGQVSFIETLVHVDHDEFRAISDNAAENYYVSWVAIGRGKA